MKLVVSCSYYNSYREELDNLVRDPNDIVKTPDEFFDMTPREYLLMDNENFIPTKD
nr:MAG TPA: tail assembly chaperone protein [Caudoviricetes sp.]